MNTCNISVIIATRNQAALLEQTLRLLRGQFVDGLTWEIIVVDNGSTDGTRKVLQNASDIPLVALEEPTAGKNRALNRALAICRGELLIFTDDDIVPPRNWLHEIYLGASRWPNDAIFGGPILPAFPMETPAFVQGPRFRDVSAHSRYELDMPEGPVCAAPFGANVAIRSALFHGGARYCETIGPAGAHYAMGSETELLWRLRDAGHRYIYLPKAQIGHIVRAHQVCLRWLASRQVRMGRGQARLEPVRDVPSLFGVPRFIIRQALPLAVYALCSVVRGQEERWLAVMQCSRIIGSIYEYYRMAQCGRDQPIPADGSSQLRHVPKATEV